MRGGGCEVGNDLGKNMKGEGGKGNVVIVVDFGLVVHTHMHAHTIYACVHTPLCALDGRAGKAVRGWRGRFREKS